MAQCKGQKLRNEPRKSIKSWAPGTNCLAQFLRNRLRKKPNDLFNSTFAFEKLAPWEELSEAP